MPRNYIVTFEQITVSAAQDLVQINGATGRILRILRAWVGVTDTALVTAQSLALRARFLPSAVSNGTGGNVSATIVKTDPGDANATFTALTNCTGKATTSGTAAILDEQGIHAYSGYDNMFARPPVIGPSEAFVFELLSTVSGTVHMSGGVLVEESGG